MATTLPTELAFGVGSFNVQNLPDLSRENVRKCASIVDAEAGMVGFQEIAEVEDDDDIESVLSPKSWIHLARASENKISVKKSRWALLDFDGAGPWAESGQEHLSNGLAAVTPERNCTWGIFEFLENPLFTPFLFADFHLVSGVDSGSAPLAERQKRRDQEFAVLTAFIAKAHDAGLPVLWVADTNWSKMPKLHPDQQWLVNDGIDKIAWVPAATGNYDLTLVSAEAHPNPSDHDFRVANVVVRANTRYKAPVVVVPPPAPKPAPAPIPVPAPAPKPVPVPVPVPKPTPAPVPATPAATPPVTVARWRIAEAVNLLTADKRAAVTTAHDQLVKMLDTLPAK